LKPSFRELLTMCRQRNDMLKQRPSVAQGSQAAGQLEEMMLCSAQKVTVSKTKGKKGHGKPPNSQQTIKRASATRRSPTRAPRVPRVVARVPARVVRLGKERCGRASRAAVLTASSPIA